MTLKLNGSSSGSVSLDAPASTTGGADRIITLPDRNQVGLGCVLQVIFASKTDVGGAYTTLAWTDTGLEEAITPTSSSSKILIQAKPCLSWDKDTSKMGCALFKGTETDPLLRADARGSRTRVHQGMYIGQFSYQGMPMPMDYLDSPNTTSATTYKVRVSALDNTGSIYMNRGTDSDSDATNGMSQVSTITLMEIAA